MTEKTFRNLKPNDSIMVGDRSVKVVRAHFCDGKKEPLQFIGGEAFQTSAALRVFFDDGSNDIVHPDMTVRTASSPDVRN